MGNYLSDLFGERSVTYAVFLAMALQCVSLALPLSITHISATTFTVLIGTLGALLLPVFGVIENNLGVRQSAFVLLFGLTLLGIAWLRLVVTSIKRKEASG